MLLASGNGANLPDRIRNSLSLQVEVVGRAEDGETLVDLAARLRPDVVVAAYRLPRLNGLQAVQQLKRLRLEAKFILLTEPADAAQAAEALQQGASGVLPTDPASQELLTAVNHALNGRTYLSPWIARPVLEALEERPDRRQATNIRLTERKTDVLRLLCAGMSAKDIGARLFISARTVEHHKYEMMRALRVRTTASLVAHAVGNGLVAEWPGSEA
jgi:DNA-binding NarL/FixJ family response regulator